MWLTWQSPSDGSHGSWESWLPGVSSSHNLSSSEAEQTGSCACWCPPVPSSSDILPVLRQNAQTHKLERGKEKEEEGRRETQGLQR